MSMLGIYGSTKCSQLKHMTNVQNIELKVHVTLSSEYICLLLPRLLQCPLPYTSESEDINRFIVCFWLF
jgi:hypothetical protein